MGQIFIPSRADVILTSVDRLVARNSDGGLSPGSQHIVLFGEDAGQNLAIDDAIAIGAFALDAGVAPAVLDGTIAIGVNALSALTLPTNGGLGVNDASTVIGWHAAEDLQFSRSNVIIGNAALDAYVGDANSTGLDQSVLIGSDVCGGQTGAGQFSSVVAIGFRALHGTGAASHVNSVIIGNVACENVNGAVNTTVIGADAAKNITGSGNTLIGRSCCSTILTSGGNNTIVGDNAQTTNATDNRNAVLGAGTNVNGDRCVLVGGFMNALPTTSRSIIIGFAAATVAPAIPTINDQFLVETVEGGVQRTILYADMATGNLVTGNSVQGTNRDFDGAASRNILKLINGVVGALAPIGGGYFYVSAGLLHFVTSTGVDRALTPAGQLANQTGAAFTNNAAAAAGTLLNSPTAGDPTKWIPINDNGTIRNIPAW